MQAEKDRQRTKIQREKAQKAQKERQIMIRAIQHEYVKMSFLIKDLKKTSNPKWRR